MQQRLFKNIDKTFNNEASKNENLGNFLKNIFSALNSNASNFY